MTNQPKLTKRTCEMCGELFMARVSDVKRGFGTLCSHRCRAMYSNTKKFRVAPEFKRVAPTVK